ncbi:hypothetical protein CP8484711_1875, partial [Chlamydia psittaci 84-8471/1]
IHNLKHSK